MTDGRASRFDKALPPGNFPILEGLFVVLIDRLAKLGHRPSNIGHRFFLSSFINIFDPHLNPTS
jgi:hypothetical protein